MSSRLIAIISPAGEVTLPEAVRKRRGWTAGATLLVEDMPEGVLLRAEPVFAETRPQDVFASLRHRGKPKTLRAMNAAVRAQIRRLNIRACGRQKKR